MSSFLDHERRFKTAVPMGQCLLMPGVRYEVGAAGGPTGRGDTRLLSSRRAVCPLPMSWGMWEDVPQMSILPTSAGKEGRLEKRVKEVCCAGVSEASCCPCPSALCSRPGLMPSTLPVSHQTKDPQFFLLSPPQKDIPTSPKLRHIGIEIFKWSHSAVLSPVHTAPEEDKREGGSLQTATHAASYITDLSDLPHLL